MSSAVQKVFQILLYILILVYSIMYKILSFSVWYTFVSEILSMILTLSLVIEGEWMQYFYLKWLKTKNEHVEYLWGIHSPQRPYSAMLKQLVLKDLRGEGKASLLGPVPVPQSPLPTLFCVYNSLTGGWIVSCSSNIISS